MTALMSSWIDFSCLHEFRNSDSIVPVLVSLMKWSPFYWGQDRFGMLIPLLVAPVHSPFANLLVQAWLGTFAGLFASFLLLRYALGNRPTWLTAGAIVNLAAFLSPLRIQCDWFFTQPYGVSLTLALSAFLLLEKPRVFRWTLAIVLMLLAHWVNIAAFALLVPLVVLHYLLEKQQSDLTVFLPCLSLGALGGWLIMRTSPYHGATQVGLMRLAEWPSAWGHLAQTTREMMPPYPGQLLWLIIPVAAAVISLLVRPSLEARRFLQIAAALGGAGLINWLFVGTLVWVHDNSYSSRYAYPALLFGAAALAILVAGPLEMAVGSKRALTTVALLVFATIGYRYGRPSVAQVRRALDQHFGRMTEEILITHAAILAGNYWTVWPAVFHANLVLYARGEQEVVYGVTDRSYVTSPLWADIPRKQLCAAAPVDDAQAGKYMDLARIRFTRVEQHHAVKIFELGEGSSCHRSSKTEPPRLGTEMTHLMKALLARLHFRVGVRRS
jgi:hypothetical protein